MIRAAALVGSLVLGASSLAWGTCQVNGQQPLISCQKTEVIATSEFTQDLVVREPTEANGWFDRIQIEAGGSLKLRGTARWTVDVLQNGQLTVHGMAKEIWVRGGQVEIRGMADEIVVEDGEVLISGVVGRVLGESGISVAHGAVIAARPETRGQPGDRFPYPGAR